MLVLTNSGVVDENGRIAMSLANRTTEVDEVGEICDVALIVVNFRH